MASMRIPAAFAVVLRSRLYQMMPIRGEMFVADASGRRSIIVVWRWILSGGAQAERTWGDTFA